MNARDLLKMNVSDVLRMNVSEVLTVDLTEPLPPAPTVPPPAPAVARFEPDPGAPAVAREFTRDVVQGWADLHLVDPEAVEKAAIVVSEFVTRSVQVGSGGTVVVRLADGLHVEITADQADFDPEVRSLGTHVVDAVSDSWGVAYTWPHYRELWSDVAV